MRPPAPAFRGDYADRWRRATVPWWVTRRVLPLGWLATMTWALFGPGDELPCSPSDPLICGPDYVFAITATLAFLVPVFLFWSPVVGCLFGVVVGVLDVAFDPDPAISAGFGAFAVCCAAVGAWLVTAARRQRMVVEEAARWRRVVLPPSRQAVGSDDRAIFSAVAAVVGVALFTCFGLSVGIEQTHLRRAQVVDATVMAFDDEYYTVDLRVGDRRFTEVDVLDQYEKGAIVQVRIDPADASWIRLVAEPHDATGWFAGGLGALILAGGLSWREFANRRRLRRLFESPQVGVEVLLARNSSGWLSIYAADDGTRRRPLATWSEISWMDRGARKRPQQVTIVGDLRIGGMVVVAGEHGVAIPGSPLRQPVRRRSYPRLRQHLASHRR